MSDVYGEAVSHTMIVRNEDDNEATERFKDLVEDIGTMCGFADGWKTEAATILRTSPSFLSKVINGTRRVGLRTFRDAEIGARLALDLAATTAKNATVVRNLRRPEPTVVDAMREMTEIVETKNAVAVLVVVIGADGTAHRKLTTTARPDGSLEYLVGATHRYLSKIWSDE